MLQPLLNLIREALLDEPMLPVDESVVQARKQAGKAWLFSDTVAGTNASTVIRWTGEQ